MHIYSGYSVLSSIMDKLCLMNQWLQNNAIRRCGIGR